ncbi:tyrosine-type recombinase/integrase [Vibrio hepatarius]|uniref:tyrosine-type recombinase/integrase n=1 Tax=Vibrio hepatarius TaxID=171383 RepID=UPI002090E5DA|nr:tyrosine-type recombinase/integrase [Vibrio hepatarius]
MIDLWQERPSQSLAHSKYTYNKLKVIGLAIVDPLYQKVTFTQTKGKKKRSVPISPELYDVIYKEGSGPLFNIGYSTVYRFIVRNVPRLKQQAAHVLRHTFASYYMMNGGNIIALQRILGHSDIKQTMRYAHLAPDHLEDVVTKNPLANLK